MSVLVASAKPNSSLVLDMRKGVKYHLHNRQVIVWEDRRTGETRTEPIGKFVTSRDYNLDVLDLAKRRYRRAIRIFRETIDAILLKVYTTVPVYRDCYVSDIIALIHSHKATKIEELSPIIFEFIKEKNNGD